MWPVYLIRCCNLNIVLQNLIKNRNKKDEERKQKECMMLAKAF